MATFADWREPVTLLEQRAGPASSTQLALAALTGLDVRDEPFDVAGAMLEDHLRPAIWGIEAVMATDRQRGFLEQLGGDVHRDPAMSRAVASAWIEHYLRLRTIRSLRELMLSAGDAVTKHTTFVEPGTGKTAAHQSLGIVSSIGANGLVYFRGGNGQCAWPSSLTRMI